MKLAGVSWPSILGGVLALLAIAVLLVLTINVLLVPFVAAMFLAYLYEPGIQALERRGMDRGKAYITLLVLTTAGIIGLLVLLKFTPYLQGDSAGASAQTFKDRLDVQLNAAERWVQSILPTFKRVSIRSRITEGAEGMAEHLFLALPSLLTSFILNLILVPFIAYFMVRDGRNLKRQIVAQVPNRYFEMSLIMFDRIDKQIGGYLRGRLIECMLVGLVQLLMMALASVFVPQPQILLIAAVCGITNLIPYAGPLLGGAFGAFMYFSAGHGMDSILTLFGIIAVAHLIDNVIIAPAVLSHNVDLHPLTVALVLVIGGEVLGILGLLIAVPVAASIKVIGQEFYANYQTQVR